MRARRQGWVCVLLSLTLLTGPSPALADDEDTAATATPVVGRVVDENGWPLAELAASLESPDAPIWGDTWTHTDAAGGFRFDLELDTAVSGAQVLLWDDLGQFADRSLTAPELTPGVAVDLGTIVLRSFPNIGRSATAVDTTSRAAVRAAYARGYAKLVRKEKTPKVHGCTVGATSGALQRREVAAINYFRSMAGLNPVRLDSGLSAKATKAALIQAKQRHLNHYPSTRAKCYTAIGGETSARSNLSYGWVGARNIGGYIADPGSHNYPAGHRLWLLNPTMQRYGTGYAGTYNAGYVVADEPDAFLATSPIPAWLPWPSAGYFPSQLEPGGRWSFTTARSDVDFTRATVAVRVNGKVVKIRPHLTGGYGYQAGLTWDFAKRPKVTAKGSVTVAVTVSGISVRGVTTVNQAYQVILFRA